MELIFEQSTREPADEQLKSSHLEQVAAVKRRVDVCWFGCNSSLST